VGQFEAFLSCSHNQMVGEACTGAHVLTCYVCQPRWGRMVQVIKFMRNWWNVLNNSAHLPM
jgi:hypothetical protein